MRKLLVAFWLCGMAAGQAPPGAADLNKATPQLAGKTARNTHTQIARHGTVYGVSAKWK